MVAGGGRVQLQVRPAPKLDGFELLERGELRRREAVVLISELPPSVGQREIWGLKGALDLTREECRVIEVDAKGPGNVVLFTLEYENVTEVFSSFGERGLRAEKVAGRLVADVRSYLADGAPVGRRLADQLLIPLALAGGGSFRTGPLSLHTETNIDVIKLFLDVAITVEGTERTRRITVNG
jgi:RNA 3'-terminal phosphate cyclase (ATP)